MLLGFILVCLIRPSTLVDAANEEGFIERADDQRRPIWNIAHMTNDIEIVKAFLNDGANALEFDIEFDEKGKPVRTFHGFPCDCCRKCHRTETFSTFIEQMRKFTTPGDPEFKKQLVLLMLDLKVTDFDVSLAYKAGRKVAKVLLNKFWQRGESKPQAYIVLSIPSLDYAKLIKGFNDKLKDEGFEFHRRKVGVDFSGNDDLDDVRNTLKSIGVRRRIWQSDGITNCLPRGTGRLREAIEKRDSPGYKYINKVYYWTLDRKSTMRSVLDLGVDGMITNFPDNLVSVLNESKYASRFRLATIKDNPWTRFVPSGSRMIEEETYDSLLDEEYADDKLKRDTQDFIIPFLAELFASCSGKALF